MLATKRKSATAQCWPPSSEQTLGGSGREPFRFVAIAAARPRRLLQACSNHVHQWPTPRGVGQTSDASPAELRMHRHDFARHHARPAFGEDGVRAGERLDAVAIVRPTESALTDPIVCRSKCR